MIRMSKSPTLSDRGRIAMLRNTLRDTREFVALYAERDRSGHAPGMLREIDDVLKVTR